MRTSDWYTNLASHILTMMENNPGNWTQPWTNPQPRNAVTEHKYRGDNWLLLSMIQDSRGWAPQWASYNQWQTIDAQVRKGEKATYILCPMLKKGEAEEKDTCYFKPAPIFNAAQVDGWTPPPPLTHDPRDLQAIHDLVAAHKIRIVEDPMAWYRPSQDIVGMPPIEHFRSITDYVGTLAHEATHWTGHESRLARTFGKVKGGTDYAFEELVAELGAAFLCSELAYAQQPRADHAQYLASWIKGLKEDKTAFFQAARLAQQAATYLTAETQT